LLTIKLTQTMTKTRFKIDRPLYTRKVTPEEFLKLSEADKENIEAVEFLKPKLGERGFGEIIIRYKIPLQPHNATGAKPKRESISTT